MLWFKKKLILYSNIYVRIVWLYSITGCKFKVYNAIIFA